MNAYASIKLVPASKIDTITTTELKEYFLYYKDITAKTGDQVDWTYGQAAFPYEIIDSNEKQAEQITLYSEKERYRAILISIQKEKIMDHDNTPRIQTNICFTLPEGATFGDKGKANEYCKFLAKKLQAELHLFNGRVMYYYKRKLQ
ncbi:MULTISPECIES: DUF1885 family protein [Cytobacillus]|uniref:DUF1885 family protein n=1 Tax=Cytobacillus stercorigallinarum TaxID=2762240 RepID=A0ABR8QMX6_9BACI|nr:DUF1885 family protein [Cytobacillus stercorigallinarum]MBD7936881.1 DUF1885 family protein [Cytobacillus stercorigallinarum]